MNECQKVVYYSKEIKTNQSHLDWDNKGTKTCAEMVFCYHNCSNVLWEKIVLVWGKKLRKKFANSRP